MSKKGPSTIPKLLKINQNSRELLNSYEMSKKAPINENQLENNISSISSEEEKRAGSEQEDNDMQFNLEL